MNEKKRVAMLCVISVMLAFTLTVGSAGSLVEWAIDRLAVSAASSGNATVSGYESQIKDLERQEEELKKKIEEFEKNSADAMKLKLTLDENLNVTYQRIDATRALIEELRGQIEKNEEDIAKLQKDLEQREEIFKERLRLAHEDRNVSYLSMLFEADGLVEFFNNIERIGALLDYDNKLMKKYQEDKIKLENVRAGLNEQINKQTQYEQDLAEDEQLLIEQQQEVDALIVQLRADEDSIKVDLEKIKAEEADLEKKLADLIKKLQEAENKEYMVKGQLTWPIKQGTKGYNRITSRYGNRDLTVGGNNVSDHRGIDIGVSYVNVYASGVGKVITATFSNSYGYYVVIDHGGGVSTLYAHLSKLSVKKNDQIKAGQLIGVSGNTGWSTGPHLHYELRINGDRVDPLNKKDKKGQFYVSRPGNLIYID
jgi:murein DD-endopeptidase MepM/ murein hydrolase activator NlpD